METTVRHSNTVAFPVEKTSSRRRQLINAEEHTNLRLQLSSLLQTTLDLPRVLALFFEQAQRHLQITSLSYQHDKLIESISLGRAARHSAEYRLVTSQDSLGELILTRRKTFSEDELQLLEMLIACLICPIRNSLLYREALQSALQDPLTGVGNRLALENTLQREIAIAHRHGYQLSLLVVDIDKFKSVNDRFGHTAGDAVLKNVAAELMHCCRDSDATYHSYRFGGEEFVMMLNHTNNVGAKIAAERIRSRIQAMDTGYEQESIKVTVSIGIASLAEGDQLQSLFQRADEAVYCAKREGRNRVINSRPPRKGGGEVRPI